jgi:ribosomal protein S18 acetylase RimI-like enzyme
MLEIIPLRTPSFFSCHNLQQTGSMTPVEYRATDISDIDLIQPLWILLNEHMRQRATTFRSHFEQMNFGERKAHFTKAAMTGLVRVDLAYDPLRGGRYVGYCVSSLSLETGGEIESIFIREGYRSLGIGSTLVNRALAWFSENGSVRNRVSVSDGNEAAGGFYKKFGFYPRMMVLELKK